ncbi:hypothetical protein HYPBUDRAFT_168279 [Hyphopichia burtonii NRRL Y-1933]|uniref:ARID domain-containing protein n=1 Tax=Hyphopichia burtonii NRRL Y-1933 TaxID=984485 RepID=A0A1E4RE58_9ASCO|nr:hypothetical protein HYPBUDRAFT_168279 [Hyphopichia burtonii NRRL Y-1933]ODV65547.1 hypothetical protein HYPBUDRAFT_168279 [Hyphopichia burtonii NRRL Y-1933]
MSNFWFNDGNQSSGIPKEDAFLNNIFDQAAQSNNQSNQQVPHNNQSMDTEMLSNPQQTLNQQGFPSQQQAPSTQQQQQKSLDKSKQEQLLQMRQQIMQQQMLHAKQQKQQQEQQQFSPSNIPMSASPQPSNAPTPQQMMNMNQGGRGQGNSQVNLVYAPSPVNNMNSPSMASSTTPQYNHLVGTPQIPQNLSRPQLQPSNPQQNPKPMQGPAQHQAQQAQQQLVSKLSPQQLQQLQYELFIATLNDFMNSRNTPITQQPIVNGKKVNLLLLHLLSQKLGGGQQLMKALQNIQPQQGNSWTAICQRLGFFEGINVQQDFNSRIQIEKETANVYIQYVLPYEQYGQTPNGARDLQTKRMMYQKKIFLKLQQLQLQQQPQQQQNAPNQLQQQMQNPPSRHISQSNMSPPANINSPGINNVPTPGAGMIHQSPIPSSAPTPQQRKLSHVSNPSAHNSPAVSQSPYMAQQTISRSGSVVQQHTPQQHSQPPPQTQTQQTMQKPTKPKPQRTPNDQTSESPQLDKPDKELEFNIIKNYVPLRKLVETHDGFDIKALSSLASEIELTKPVYLFAPELGSINVHALTMALKNYTVPNSGEIMSALNTLLVTTSDSSFSFKVTDCLELLDSLALLGLKVLDHIIGKKSKHASVYEDASKLSENNPIDDVFKKYTGNQQMFGEDVTYVVDSLSAEVIEDEDSDLDLDEVFSYEEENDTPLSNIEEEPKLERFGITDYNTTILKFKEENKYHFSKLQTKSAVDEQVMLVDQLITITMILRNLSFAEDSKAVMANDSLFKDLLFTCVKYIASYPDKFKFYRKRLCILKDCLLMLDNIAFLMELRTLEEAFLSFILISAFGPKLNENEKEESGFKIPYANLDMFSYLPFGIDAFTKLLVREPRNKTLMQAVLSGSLAASSSNSFPSVISINISAQDQQETKKLMDAYFGDDNSTKEAKLLTRSFKLLMSVIPFDSNSFEFAKFTFIRAPTLSQALFGVKLLIDLIPYDENSPLNDVLVEWLLANKDILLSNFARISLSLVTEASKYGLHSNESKILSLVILKALIVVNSLVGNALLYYRNTPSSPLKDELSKLTDAYRVLPDETSTLDSFIAPNVDVDVSQELLRLLRLLKSF